MKTIYNIAEYMTGALFNILFIIVAVVAVYFVTVQGFAFGKNLFEKDTAVPYVEHTVVIPEGSRENRADAMEVGRILEDAGLTKNALVFYVNSWLSGLDELFRPGTYTFNTHQSDDLIMEELVSLGQSYATEVQITIPEGMSLRQIGQLCEEKGFFSEEAFLKACSEYERYYHFLIEVPERDNLLEGYLFPDTYRLPQNPKPTDLIDRMLSRFAEIFDYQLEDRAAELGMTIDEVIIIASIIEKEIMVPEERVLCSSIIDNRLKSGMNLQMCSTVLYALNKHMAQLLLSDLEVDSPYNTYMYPGLPKGPICAPGRQAILAALNPADSNYLYMVLSDEEKGSHFFTNNYQEFLDAKERYNQQF
ncbi:MAG: endolytic transglycosylase MltG [Clostridiales bacterium]|jgi:UPF0755 protein|nr:endolytic transglycosylase MltG [Clostridiales bacterium]